MKDYYKILELNREAGIKEIRKSYRRLVLKFHPDVNSSTTAETKFIEIVEAYEVLKNPSKKIRYDRLYDYKILNKYSTQSKRNQNRSKTWEETVAQRQKRGRAKANRNSKKNYEKFKRKTSKTSFLDWFWGILELFGNFLEMFGVFS